MKYSIIGTGNMAWYLAGKLHDAGHECTGVYGRNNNKATELANAVNSKPYATIADIKDNSNVCIIAISDSSVAEIASQLSFQNTVLLHTAGAVGIESLSHSAPDNGVLWTMYSIVKGSYPEHRNIPCIWESSTDKAEAVIFKIADCFTDVIFFADSQQRTWLHLTAVLGNNFINHILHICHSICEQQNIPFSIAQPIIQQTFERIVNNEPYKLQTGPAVRGDQTTMGEHKTMLQQNPHWQRLYEAISTSIENTYRHKGGKDGDID